jgi:hypothetical protein
MTAMWQAIDNWPALSQAIHRKFKTEAEILYLERRELSASDIGVKSACAIHTGEIDVALRTNQGLNWPVAIRVDLYLSLGRYLTAHDLIEDVIEAVYQAHGEGSTATYLELAACGHPTSVGNVKVVKEEFGNGDQPFAVWNASAVFLFGFNKSSIR